MSEPRILIVENEAIVAEDLAVKVRSLGYDVTGIFSTGEKAVEAATQSPPDLVLLDLQLAGAWGGIETAHQFKQLDIPVIFVTAHSDRTTVREATASGFSGYVLKPFGERDLAIQIDIALYKAQANRALRDKEERLRHLNEELAQETAALTRLNELSSRLWRRATLQEGLDDMLAATIELVGADKGDIQLMADDDVLEIAAQQGFDEDFLAFFERVSTTDNSACGRALRSGQRVIIEDIECDPEYAALRAIAHKAGYRAVQSTPLISSAGRPLGMLSTHWRSIHRPSTNELHRLDLYARQATDFIERAIGDDALRRSEKAAQDLALFPAQNPSPVLRVGKNGTLLYMNPASSHLLHGLELRIGHPVPRGLFDLVRGSLQAAQPQRAEYHIEPRDYLITITPIRGHHYANLYWTDITEHKQAEQALRESEERSRTLGDHMSQFAWMIDHAGNAVWFNRRWYEYTGTTLEDMRGWGWRKVHHPDHEERVVASWRKALASEHPWEETFPLRGADGRYRWFLTRAQPIRDAQGTVVRWFGTNTDITEFREAEQALRTSEERFRGLVNVLPAAMYTIDIDGRITYYNDLAAELWGTRPRIGDDDSRYCGSFRLFLPDGSELPHDRTPMVQALLHGTSTRAVDVIIERPDGSRKTVSVNIDPIKDSDGMIRGAINVFTDITERRKAEEQLRASERLMRAVFNQQFAFSALLSREGQVLQFSDSVYRNNEGTDIRPQDLIGRNFLDAPWWRDLPDTVAEWRRQFSEALNRPGPARGEAPYQMGDGERRYAINSVTALRDDGGNVEYLLCEGMDITELKRAQLRLEQFAEDLERQVTVRTAELLETQDRLRALATELNLAEQRERKRLATELHDHLQQLLVLGKMQIGQGRRFALGVPACESVMKMVDEILSEALTYTRSLVADLSPPVLRDHGLAAGLKWLGEAMKKHGLMVGVTVPEGQSSKLPEDQSLLLFQSVRELLINVSKHAGTGEALVEMVEREGRLAITVHDQGNGFDLAAAAVIAGSTGSAGITSKFGLFSIRERMRALDGSFDIESEPGRGTRATLTLPVAAACADRAMSREHVQPLIGNQATTSNGAVREKSVRVVLVDDHAMVRQGLRSILAGYPDLEILGEAANGVEALCAVEQHRPTVVIMDINMPQMDGIEATARIKARYPEMCIIGLSVNAGQENQQAMLNAGAAALLTKEAVVEQLYGAIQDAMKSHQPSLAIGTSNQVTV